MFDLKKLWKKKIENEHVKKWTKIFVKKDTEKIL